MKVTRTAGGVGRGGLQPVELPAGSGRRAVAEQLAGSVEKSAAFTLVEIALALAIIGFALVAIIGVLPTGLNVQRDNREETIIVQEANYFMDAIRNGAQGLDNLTNSVISITNYWTEYSTNKIPWSVNRANVDGYTSHVGDPSLKSRVTSTGVADDAFALTDGYRIIGLLGRPKFEDVGAPNLRSNHVIAYVHALSGAASEKFPVDSATVLDLAFNYRMTVEVHPVPFAETNTAFARELAPNLRELRLIFRWPLQPKGNTGSGRQVIRTMTGGQLVTTNVLGQPLFFFEPTTFVNLKAP